MAQINISGLSNLLVNLGGGSDLESVVNSKVFDLINFAVGFSAMVAVGILIYSGYMFITSAGDADKVEKAQGGITAAVVGLVIIFIARLLVGTIISIVVNNSVN